MNPALQAMLATHPQRSLDERLLALREVVHQVALLGLWRSKFFEHAAFYGGTALRLLHGLDRYSEDLDFSLLAPRTDFSLSPYLEAVRSELTALGLPLQAATKPRQAGRIRAGVLRASVRDLLEAAEAPASAVARSHRDSRLAVKVEVDTDPPPEFATEARTLLLPVPHSVRVYRLPDLFAGKMHAVLTRRWKSRVKGRDWYDMVWFIGRNVPVGLVHLQRRLESNGDWSVGREFATADLVQLLEERISNLNVTAARADVEAFVSDPDSLALWSREFFRALIRERLQTA